MIFFLTFSRCVVCAIKFFIPPFSSAIRSPQTFALFSVRSHTVDFECVTQVLLCCRISAIRKNNIGFFKVKFLLHGDKSLSKNWSKNTRCSTKTFILCARLTGGSVNFAIKVHCIDKKKSKEKYLYIYFVNILILFPVLIATHTSVEVEEKKWILRWKEEIMWRFLHLFWPPLFGRSCKCWFKLNRWTCVGVPPSPFSVHRQHQQHLFGQDISLFGRRIGEFGDQKKTHKKMTLLPSTENECM